MFWPAPEGDGATRCMGLGERVNAPGATADVPGSRLRRQITPLFVLSLGVGFGLGEESPKFRTTVGLQYAVGFFGE